MKLNSIPFLASAATSKSVEASDVGTEPPVDLAELIEKIIPIVQKYSRPDVVITADSKLRDIGVNSGGHFYINLWCRENFGVKGDALDRTWSQVKTVRDVANAVYNARERVTDVSLAADDLAREEMSRLLQAV